LPTLRGALTCVAYQLVDADSMSQRSYILLEDRGVLTVAGEDRRPFLQGLISNDVEKASAERAIYASLLTAQGRFLHDFFIAELDDVFLLDAEGARIDDLRRRLSLYRLRAKVTLAAAPDRVVVALFGDQALPALGLPEEPGHAARLGDGIAFVDPRLMRLGARAVTTRAGIDRLAAMGFSVGDRSEYEALRYALGVPDGSRDLPIEKALLLENGFDELNGIDWKKGCYVGQELTARMKYRSLVRKRLMPVRIEGEAPAPGTPILLDREEAGEMRSALADRGLALLRLEMVERADREGRQLTAGNASLTPLKPAWAAS
jgi:folate-binding protein YgfZ